MSGRRGLSLIELLIVLVVIIILVGLVSTGATLLIFRAKSAATVKRMDEIATAINGIGVNRGGGAFTLRGRLGLDAASPSAWRTAIEATYADTALRAYAGTDSGSIASQLPSGGPAQFLLGETVGPWGRIPIAGGATAPAPRTIRTMSPLLSLFFLVEAEVVPFATAVAAYRDDRSPARAWNDRWGNPIVVSWLLYQTASGTAATEARRTYGANRLLHLSLAAGGRRIGGATGDAMTLPAEVWAHALDVASAGDAAAPIWDEGSFTDAPWRGVRATRNTRGDGWLMAPMEVR